MCGLYGFVNYSGEKMKNLADLTNSLSEHSAVRGTDATGIAFCNSSGISVLKESKSAFRIDFKHSDEICSLTGHTRHSTQGSEKHNYNNHPFSGKCKNSKFALSHNGVLSNDRTLRKELNLPKTKIETDSYIAVQLIESQKKLDFESIKYMAEKTEGSFSYSKTPPQGEFEKEPYDDYEYLQNLLIECIPDFRLRLKLHPKTRRMEFCADVNSVFDIAWYTLARMLSEQPEPEQVGKVHDRPEGIMVCCKNCGHFIIRTAKHQQYCNNKECQKVRNAQNQREFRRGKAMERVYNK